MADLYDEFQIGQDPQSNQQTGGDLFDEFGLNAPEPEGKGVLGHARDIGLSAAKSVIGVPEAMVGLADIPTGGAVGKALENEGGTFGVRFKQAKDMLSDLHTDQYKQQRQQFQDADGIIDKAGVALTNPSLIVNPVVESVGPMLAGGAIGKGVGAAKKVAPVVAGAIGEGSMMAGAQAEGIRQQTEDGLLTAEQAGIAGATGALGGLFGWAGGRLAQKLGIGDVDTMLASGVKQQQVAAEVANTPAKSVPRQVIEGAIGEGFLEELPQSISEQVLQNLALDKPWSDGVDDAAVMGVLAGMVMGGGAAGVHGLGNRTATADDQADLQPAPAASNPNPAPIPRPDPSAGPLSAAANLLPAPEDTGTLYGDEAGNVSGNRPSWVNPENDPSRQSYGPGMDRQASGPIDIEGEVVARGPLQQAAGPTQAALPDLRQGAMIVDSEGNAQPGKLPNTPPRSYVQGGRGMDQQAPIGQRFSNPLAAKNAISKAPEPAALEVVEVGPKQFEVQVKAPVLQNRDRSTPASITQMRSIAANPDYSRLGFSRDFANGAPVVEPGANVLPQALGRQDVATTGSGRKIPVQYAVVEAASLMPSHDVNGSPDEQYATGAKGKSRAIAGNGRVAGLRHAFTQGTAGQYVEQMAGDASLHGISPAVIRGMKEPVLVRIMPREEITQDIGDESNTTGVSALSGAEQAMNDARRISIDDMEFSESGEISETTVRQFVQSMPAAERNNLLDGSRPSRQAYDRAESAIFANAYESEALIRLQAQATDPEVRTVLSGLLVAAPKMARLKGAGAWDIRGLVVEAAEAAVNARRSGQTLEQFAQQIDLDRNPESQYFIELFAANIRSAKRIGEELSAVADGFYTEVAKPEFDMLGAVPRRSRQDLLNGAPDADTTRTPANSQTAGNQAGAGTAAADGQARDAERAEPAGAGADARPESFQLDSYSEEELAAQAAAQAEAAAQAAAADKAAADKAQADRDRNDFTLTGSDRPSDVAAARGQSDMFAPPTRGAKKVGDGITATAPTAKNAGDQEGVATFKATSLVGESVTKRPNIAAIERFAAAEDLHGLMRFMVDRAPSEAYRTIAARVTKKIEAMQAAGVEVTLARSELDTAGRTKPTFNGAYYVMLGAGKGDLGGFSYEVALHELTHVAIAASLRDADAKVVKDLEKILEVVKAQGDRIKGNPEPKGLGDAERVYLDSFLNRNGRSSNALKNIDELVAWGLSNPAFQGWLDSIQMPGAQRTVWVDFVRAVRGLLGLPVTTHSALSEVLQAADQLLTDETVSSEPAVKAKQAKQAEKAGIQAATNSLSNGQYGATITLAPKGRGDGEARQLMVRPDGSHYWGDWHTKKHRDLGVIAGGRDKDGTPAYFASKAEAIAAALRLHGGESSSTPEAIDPSAMRPTVPIEDGRKAQQLRDMRELGRKAGESGESRSVPDWAKNSSLEDAWLDGYGAGMAARVQREQESQQSDNRIPSPEQAELNSRHKKIDKTIDLMDDAQVEDLFKRAGLAGARLDNLQKREALKQEHPDDIESLLNQASERPKAEPKPPVSGNTIFTDDAAEKARALIRSKLGQLNSGVDPELLQAGIVLAGWHIEKGARTFAAYAKAMIGDMGDSVRPYLKQWYLATKFDPRSAGLDGLSTAQVVEAANLDDILGPQVKDEAKSETQGKSLADHFYQRITDGSLPKDNRELRKLVSDFDGAEADNARLKEAQEDLEAAIARRAADIASQNKGDAEAFRQLLDLYSSQPNLNIRTSSSIENQAYSTPAPLAYLAARLADVDRSASVYEPTAGNGMLLLTADPKKATANELQDHRFANLTARGFNTIQGDALEALSSGALPAKSQDAVITNPPFGSVKDDSGKPIKVSVDGYKIGQIDHLIVTESLKAMKDDGKAVLIIGANKVQGGVSTDDRIFFNWLYSNYNVTSHFEVDGALYARQGASWPVRVISINGRAKSSRVSPVSGTIQRYNTWESVYEQYNEALGAQERGAEPVGSAGGAVQQPAGNDARTAQAVAGGQGTQAVQGSRGGASAASDGNVAGAPAGTVRNQPASDAGGTAAAADGKRHDDGGAEPNQLDGRGQRQADEQPASGKSVAGTDAGKPAGSPVTDGENSFQTAYVPRSSRKDEGVLVPVNMADPLQNALSALEDQVGDIDQFAMRELGYQSVEALHDALMGLQVDSVASAINQIKESGKGIIIADQTGIGKGRQAAAMIRWAARNGYTPVFVTVKPQLFTDMYGDLADIGTHDIEPFIMNSDAAISSPAGDKLFANKPSTHKRNLSHMAATGELPDERNALFMTYSQINTENNQRAALSALAPNAIVILDESHNASGESKTGEYMTSVLAQAKGVVYLSATYAKRPDNMPLYFKTDIGQAISDSSSLIEAMASGGLPLQTVIANNLVKAGQMFRRERSYDGVSISTIVDTESREAHEALSDSVTEALRAIVDADRMFHSVTVASMQEDAEAAGEAVFDNAGNQASESVDHTQFSSVVHNFVRQMLLGLKANAAADRAIEALKRGEKPLIALENTMGSFLSEYATNNELKQGDSLGDFTYRTVLSRALARTLYVIRQDGAGNKVREEVPLSALSPSVRAMYDKAQDIIDRLDINIPVSPLDWIRQRIADAGYSVAEITGRSIAVDYSKGEPTLSALSAAEQQDKVGTTRKFNSGELDAIILNVAGSTGISLHASEKFKDQRKRLMIVAQPAQDINIFMQMLGRVHRTGQVVVPGYELLNVDLPTEKRPTALLNGKMKSLNANTSSNTESATSIKAADMLNKYGDQVIASYLLDNDDLMLALDVASKIDSNGKPMDGFARTVTGRMALMPIQVQKDFYAEVEEQYATLMEYLNATNQNDLEPRTFDFEAVLKKDEVLVAATDPRTPFGEEAVYGEWQIKAQGKQMTAEEIRAEMAENLGGKSAGEHAADLSAAALKAYWEGYNELVKAGRVEGGKTVDVAEATARGPGAAGNAAVTGGNYFFRQHAIGTMWRVEINGDVYNATITNLRNSHKKSGNPFSLSKIQVTLAVNGPLRSLTVPASQWKAIEIAPIYGVSIENAYRDQVDGSEKAKIITGNLLAAYGEIKDTTGTIISFTKQDGTTEQGILLPKRFDFKANTRGDYQFRSAADALKFLNTSTDPNLARFGIASRAGDVRVRPSYGDIAIAVPKSKARGGRYFLDKRLIAITGDFVSGSDGMVAVVSKAKAQEALNYLMAKAPLYALPSMAEDARAMVEGGKAGGNYRLNAESAKGIPLFSAQSIAKKLSASLGLNVEAVPNEAGLPEHLQAQIKRDRVSGRVAGLYDPATGISYIVASNLHDTKHAIAMVLHEAIGHGGVKAVLGERLESVMRGIYRDMPRALRDELERRYAGQLSGLASEAERQALVAEEYVAHLAEHDPQNRLLDRIVALVKQFIRKVFGADAAGKWSRADVVQLLAEAKRAAAGRGPNGGGTRYRDGAALDQAGLPEVGEVSEAEFVASLQAAGAERAFASAIYKARGTASPFFQRWFGNSRMVDKQGRPVLFTHRSYGERDSFNDEGLGGNTGTATAHLGHFLARKDVGNVERYGPNVEQFYVKMEKPKVITQDQFEAMGDWSVNQVKAYRKALMEQGYDGLYIQGLAWPVVFEGKNIKARRNAGTFDGSDNVRYAAQLQTETPAFKRWFGDSKVVDADGKPLVVYHGTTGDFSAFDSNMLGSSTQHKTAGLGFFTTTSQGVPDIFTRPKRGSEAERESYARANRLERKLVEAAGFDSIFAMPAHTPERKAIHDAVNAERAASNFADGANVMPLYLSIQNPLELSAEEWVKATGWAFADASDEAIDNIAERIKAGKHDGLMIRATGAGELAGVTWVAFSPEQIKSAIGNNGDFDPANADIRYSLNSTAAEREALRKLGLGGNQGGLSKLAEAISNLTTGDLKTKIKSMATRAEEGLFDGLVGIKRAEEAVGVNDPNRQGYVSARLATGLADVMHGVLYYGAPEWRDGMVQRREGTRGVLEILGDLGQDNLQAWLGWLGGKRAQLLKNEGRENNLSDADIAELLAMADGKEALFERIYQEYAAINDAVLDMAEQAGLVDPAAREQWATAYYVPFYRQLESEGIFTGPRTKRGLSHQTAAIKKLKGGKLPTNDLLVNILSGWTKRIDASMKNKALLETVDNLAGSDYLTDEGMRWTRLVVPRSEVVKKIRGDRNYLEFWAEQLGLDETANHLQVAHELNKLDARGYEELWGKVAPTDPDIIRVQRGGKNEFYRVNDESLLRGLKFIEGSTFNDPITRIGRTFKRILTTGVTASPDFILRNFIRDAAHAWTINKDGFTLGVDSIKGMRDAFREDSDYRDLMFAGASFQGGYIHGTDPEASADIIRRALAKKGLNRQQQDGYLGSLVNSPAKAGAMLRTGWEKYREFGDKVENANRLSTYKAALAAGKSKRQAAFEAKDLMDFSMRGNFAAAQWFTDVVPFLNARAQGLYKLGRAMKGDRTLIAKEVAIKGGYLALFTLLLAAANGDDERYKALPDWDKDANWHLWFSEDQEQPFRIPKPFELGLLFGTLPERLLHAMTGNQDSGDLAKAVAHGVFQTLAFNPVPQFYQPIRELQANRNFFFDTPIEDMSDEGKLPEARYDERTSALSRSLGQVTGPSIGVSPKQLDHLVRGYTGTLGGYVLSVSNLIAGIGSDAERPAATAGDIPVIKVIYSGETVKSTQYQTEFYDMMQEAEQLHRTIRSYTEEGKMDEARELFEENRDKLRHRPALGFARKQLGNVRKQMDAVYRDTSMDAAAKREKLNALQERANAIAKRVTELAGEDF